MFRKFWFVLLLVSCSGGALEITADTPVGDFAVRYIKVPVTDLTCQDRLAECFLQIRVIQDECIVLEEGDPGFMGPDGSMMLRYRYD
tara:strand:- start:1647 stop:1907 length:261 start_codon:yes stop_codon:yes gene_type:complete